MLTQDEKNNILLKAIKLHTESSYLRLGQCVFNITYELFPNKANKLRASDVDCFHQDSKILSFLESL